MPRVLQLQASTTGGGGARCFFFVPSPSRIQIVPGMAIEIIEQIDAATPMAIGKHIDYFLRLASFLYQIDVANLPDQNGWRELGQTPAPFATTIYPWLRERWYHRVISLDAYVGLSVARLDLAAVGGLAGTYTHRFARVALTKYREPVYWFWKDGMPMPTSVGQTAPFSGGYLCHIDMHEHFPLLCTTEETPDSVTDSIKQERSSGGTARRSVEWARQKDEFALEFPAMTELERQALLAFYNVYRGGDDWFFWQHRSNYPVQRVLFGGPPVIVPVKFNGADMRYRARVPLVEV